MNIGPPELLLVLVILVLVFGVGRIGRLGGELGSAIRAFRQGLSDDNDSPPDSAAATVQETPDSRRPENR